VAVVGVIASASDDGMPTRLKKASRPPDMSVVAQATEMDGKVVVRFSLPVEVPDGADPVGGPDRALVIGARSKMGWFDVEEPSIVEIGEGVGDGSSPKHSRRNLIARGAMVSH
jgi:hypothetical protein